MCTIMQCAYNAAKFCGIDPCVVFLGCVQLEAVIHWGMWSIALKWLYSVPFSELLYVLGLLEFTYAQLSVSLDFTSNEVLGLAKITYCKIC